MKYRNRYGLLVIIFAMLGLYSGASLAGTADHRAQCQGWLQKHYKSYSLINRIREYTKNSLYHYRANYKVVPYSAAPTSVGFNCTVNVTTGRVAASPRLKLYSEDRKPNASTGSLSSKRMAYGGDACPSLSAWKKFADQVLSGKSGHLSTACKWLDQGQKVYGPIKTETYRGQGFVLVALAGGKKYWIEASNL